MVIKSNSNARPLLIVKIGGSLHASPYLSAWIEALKKYPHRLTLVCGGGPFAETVRQTQRQMRFNDVAAHAMALLAMEQYSLALASLFGLECATTISEMDALHARGSIALWRPTRLINEANDIFTNWDVTSDSLAAWLAHKTGANAMILVKSIDIDPTTTLAEAAALQYVDVAFPFYAEAMPVCVAGPRALPEALSRLSEGVLPGVPLSVSLQKAAS